MEHATTKLKNYLSGIYELKNEGNGFASRGSFYVSRIYKEEHLHKK